MNLTLYKMTPLEEWIAEKYLAHSIFTPEDLDIHRIANIFGGEISYLPTKLNISV